MKEKSWTMNSGPTAANRIVKIAGVESNHRRRRSRRMRYRETSSAVVMSVSQKARGAVVDGDGYKLSDTVLGLLSRIRLEKHETRAVVESCMHLNGSSNEDEVLDRGVQQA